MANKISDQTIEYAGILAKLELSPEEKEEVEPMSHVFPLNNVFREDIVTNGDERERILSNAPRHKDGAFKVPKTVE